MLTVILQVGVAFLFGGGCVCTYLWVRTENKKFIKEVDSSLSIELLTMVHKRYRVTKTEYDDIYIIRYKMFRRVYVDHMAVGRSIRFLLNQATKHELCFKLVNDYIESINEVVSDLGMKDKVDFIYNKKSRSVQLSIFTEKEEVSR